jgi:hypothetical protein
MTLQLIDGHFDAKDAIDLLTQMIHVKIKFHENKMINCNSEEDMKMREKKIKLLQKELFEARNYIEKQTGHIKMFSEINL